MAQMVKAMHDYGILGSKPACPYSGLSVNGLLGMLDQIALPVWYETSQQHDHDECDVSEQINEIRNHAEELLSSGARWWFDAFFTN